MTLPPLRKAIIPAAGFGTRLFPATKAVKKEFFPIVGPDGIARPAILYMVEEALSAGVEEVILVVRPDDRAAFEAFFTRPVPADHAARLPPHLRDYEQRILQIGQRVQFAIQAQQEGFGHAVHCARERAGDEPILLMLGDHLYRSSTRQTCARQLVDEYRQHGGSVVGLAVVPEDDLPSRGVVAGQWVEAHRLLQIARIVEKPLVEEARRHLRIEDISEGRYLALFGQTILHPAIFDILDRHIRENRRERGEFQLTSALEALREQLGCLGLVIQGETYDIGQPRFYLEALRAFSREP